MTIQPGDVVTILDNVTTYDVTEVADDMARIWPVDEADTRSGQWVGLDLLRPIQRGDLEELAYEVAGLTPEDLAEVDHGSRKD